MKRKIAFILSILFAVSLVFAVGITTAFAAGPDKNGVAMTVQLDNRSYGNGDAVKPVITIGNNGTNPIAITALTCNGTSVLPSGGITIAAGKQESTQPSIAAAFASGSTTEALSFAMTYGINGLSGTPGPAALVEGIQINQASTVNVTASDSVSSKSINAGDKPTFTFKVTNSGNVAISNASLKAPPLNSGNVIGTPFSLNPGDSKTMTWSEGINQTISVKPVLYYTANSTNKTQNLSALSVSVKQVANSSMTVNLTSDKSTINAGDSINITATIANTGTDTLKNIKLLDGNSNPITLQVTSLPAGQSTTATIPESPQATANYQFTATATNSTSSAVNATSNQLTVTIGGGASASPSSSATDTGSASVAALSIRVDADSYTLDKPGNVKLQVTIQNTSDVSLSNVSVTEKTIGKIGTTISTMGKDTKTFTTTTQVDKSTQFVFTVTATQPDGKTVTAVTDPLSITVSGGGALFGGDMMTTILVIVIIAIAVIGLILFLLYRRNKSGGGDFGGGSGKNAYAVNRKPASYNNVPRNNVRDTEPPKVVRKPVSAPTRPPVKKDTKFGDRNKF